MDNRRTLTFFLLFVAAWLWVGPRLFPNLFPKPPVRPAQQQAAADRKPNEIPAVVPGQADPAQPAAPAEVVRHPHRKIVLGPPAEQQNPETYLRVALTTQGAAIESAELLDPRYTTLDRKQPLKVVGNPYPGVAARGESARQTLETTLADIDVQLKPHNLTLDEADWEVVPGSESETGVTFRYRAPDGKLEVRKSYAIQKAPMDRADFDPKGYLVKVDLTVENLTDQLVKTRYEMLGPAGLPLEDPENARTFVELKAGVIEDPRYPGDVTATSPLLAAAVVKELDNAAAKNDVSGLTIWSKPFRYVGADVQYFAALLVPRERQGVDNDKDGKADIYFNDARPVILHRNAHPELSAVTLEFTSTELEIPAKSSTTHKFDLYLGPKRADLMDALDARPVMNYGWWHRVSAALIWVLTFFHHTLHLPYWACIVLLTCCVRGLMFPISMKQTASAAKMKEIQPELTELRKKYAKEPEKFALAQRELFRKHNHNPFAGCLPVFLQLPIFIGLYNALYYAIDLRLARFLWVDNLAAPDALFRFPGPLPLLGWHEFNLLPILTCGLFLVQQRMFLPPAETDEQRMTNKMMNFMTIFMGFMFYKSPAGLCLYFMASSLWGIAERKLLDRMKPQIEARNAAKQKARDERKKAKGEQPGQSWLERLAVAADEARKQSANQKLADSKKESRSRK
ncbi:Membrane protein insertase YidC [Caulifigura coniformis]|uniref:Membrane protein insertase YidC n=1 Tax=Caulifigura coniformis TaxID=2527983 RepID=A0A517S8A5_9PLAN|nr:membrane protein insertase YidC [Caulifigura coniformis]QDT52342.1 Membrane protein insertase YidC [Caulifigura coniformis]